MAVGAPGGRTLELSEQGITGDRAQRLLSPGYMRFATWSRPAAAGTTGSPPVVSINPRQVAVADGGSCAASTPGLECAPSGFVALESGVDSGGVTMVTASRDPHSGPELAIALTDAARGRLARVTERMPAEVPPLNMLAIVVDDVLVSNATIHQPLGSGPVVVSGGLISDQPGYAADLATLVNTSRVTPYKVTSQSNL
ncbi:MAG: hypothetical protein NVS3B24_10020 [Candidatus Dormibacteria bacterium]